MSGPLQFPEEPPGVFFSVGGSSDELEDKIDNQEYRNRLSAIISDEERSSSEKLQAMLQLGTEWFGVDHGHLVHIDPAKGTHTITEVSGPHPKLSRGMTVPLSTTYCRRVIAGGDGMAVENAPEQGLAGDRAYQEFGFATYLGAKVVVGGQLYGTVCFVGEEPRVEPFTESDAAALALIVRTVGQELERRRREDRLRRTRARLEALFEESPNMIYIHDLEGNLILPNPRLCEQTGYDEENLTNAKVWDLDLELSSETAQALWAEMEPGDRQRREGRYQRSDGSTFPVEVDVRRLDLEGEDRFVATGRDVTRRKEQERKLAEREARYRAIAEQARDAIVTIDADSTVQFANPAVEDVFGYAPDELVGESLTTLIPERFRESHLEGVDHFLDTGERTTDWSSVEFPGVRKDGEEIELSISYSEYEHRGEMRFEGIMRDVTERNRRERKLRVLSEAMEQAREAVLITEAGPLDEPGPGIVYVNTAFEEMTGYEEDEVLGKSPRILQGPETEQEVLDSLREALEAGDPWQGETINYRKDGTSFILQWNVAPVRNGDGEIEYWMSVQRDVTEKRAREERLARMAQALEQVDDKVFITNREGQIQYVNTAFEEITGYREEEVLGKTPAVLHSGEQDDVFYEELWETLLSGETFRAEFTNERKGGTRYVENETISPVTDEEGGITHFVSSGRDVTERKRREEALKERQQKVESLYRATNRLLTAERPGAVADRFQELLRDVFDYPLHGVNFVQNGRLVPERSALADDAQLPEIRSLAIGGSSVAARAYRKGETVVIEDVHALDNEIDYGDLCCAAAVPIGEHGAVVIGRVEGSGFDPFNLRLVEILAAHAATVLDRIEREEALQEERDLLDRVFETSPAAIVVLNAEGKIIRVSGRAKDTFGIEVDEVMDHIYEDLEVEITNPDGSPIPDGDLPFVQIISTGEPVYDVELAVEWPGGTRRLLSVSGAPLTTPDGEVEGTVFHLEDVTERRAAERKLRQSEQRFRGVFENAAIGMGLLDGEGRLLDVNPALGQMTGYDADELTGRHFAELTHPDDLEADRRCFEELLSGERDGYQMEKRYVCKDGEVFWGRLTVSRHDGSDEEQVIGMVEDIDERKRYEKNLRDAKEEAEEASRLKSAMLANMSHEIRTPLTAITGFAELLRDRLEGELAAFGERIYRGGQRLMSTLDSVLELSKLEAGVYELKHEPVRLDEVVVDALNLLRRKADEKSLALETNLPDEPVEGTWHEAALNRIVENLLENAIKFTPEGGTVTVRLKEEGADVVFEVEDTGIGISEEALPKIFEAFKQESEGLDREYEGSGLGLSLVKMLVEALSGEITVESEKEEGTCFTVVLPRHPESNSSS